MRVAPIKDDAIVERGRQRQDRRTVQPRNETINHSRTLVELPLRSQAVEAIEARGSARNRTSPIRV